MPNPEASVSTTNGSAKFGNASTRILAMACFRVTKAWLAASF